MDDALPDTAPTLPALTPEAVERIRKSPHFDADWYVKTYPDVALLGMDPAEHYLKYGKMLGRNPGPVSEPAIGPSRVLAAPRVSRSKRRVFGMATVPERAAAFAEAFASIAGQADWIHVYLNGHSEVPHGLRGLRNVSTYLSQEHDDRGDAGKFFALDPGADCFYFSVDDDIVYPDDYAETMIRKSGQYRLPVGVHGSILKFPDPSYYDKGGRYVIHFRDSNACDRQVHILGTGTLCVDTGNIPFGPDLPYRNMADIWVARHFHRLGIPQICVARSYNWLRPIKAEESTIWDANQGGVSVQRRIVESEIGRFSERAATVRMKRKRFLVGVKTYNRLAYLRECVESIVATAEPDADVVLAIADDGSTDGTADYLGSLRAPLPIHILRNRRRYACGQFNTLMDLSTALGCDFTFILDDDVTFLKSGWISGYYNAAMTSGYHHLCHYSIGHHAQLADKRGYAPEPTISRHSRFDLASYGPVESVMGAVMTMSPEVFKSVGYADETNFSVRGQWHVDYSARACRAGFNELGRFFDLAGSNDFIELQNTRQAEYLPSIDWKADEFRKVAAAEEVERRRAIVRQRDRVYSVQTPPFLKMPMATAKTVLVNDVFDYVKVINLDRRDDRLAIVSQRLRNLGIAFERQAAVDGRDPKIRKDFDALVRDFPASGESRIADSVGFYMGDFSYSERVRYLYRQLGTAPLRSPGAYAYLINWRNILVEALDRGADRILVLDDDCVFHRDFAMLFDRCMAEIPASWKIFQLGTMQYHGDKVSRYSEHLYRPHGFVVGSHAVGLERETFALLLELVERMTLPFDMGPLQTASRLLEDSSFVAQPNLAIQDHSESDINSSDAVAGDDMKGTAQRLGWSLNDYVW